MTLLDLFKAAVIVVVVLIAVGLVWVRHESHLIDRYPDEDDG